MVTWVMSFFFLPTFFAVGNGVASSCSVWTGACGTAADGSLMMLPQTTSKWTTVDGMPVTVAAADAAKNTYIKISCKIKNGDTYLIGSENTYGEVYIPFAAAWAMGKKYIYTINIGTGTGGFDVNGKPLIQPISYSVDVDEWGEAVNGNVPQPEPEPAAESTAVDLGLSVKWAAGNVGAINPEDYGLYFAWGETTGYTAEQVENGERVFDKVNYKARNILKNLTLELDAAHVNLGGNWQMPTTDYYQELIDNCIYSFYSNYRGTGVACAVFKSMVNGNELVIPCTGYYNGITKLSGGYAYCWSSSWISSSAAKRGYGSNTFTATSTSNRYYGMNVRAIVPGTRTPGSGTGTENNYKYVDLGLPSGLKWATCNVGATSPEQAGLYFAWGETTGYTSKQVTSGVRAFSKDVYNSGPAASISTDLTLEQDAVRANLGGNWRMPNKDDYQELFDNCNVTWVSNYKEKGVAGRLFISNINGNMLFFPAAGTGNNSSVNNIGSTGYYWSASWESSPSAYQLYFNCGEQSISYYHRYYGRPVRGVCE